ncbi:MAG: M23 family metallopeptidase, partial [Rubrobacteridae bacterium]|nr:M23 family metallopeptidase [Rubrobacteridae bacterium]
MVRRLTLLFVTTIIILSFYSGSSLAAGSYTWPVTGDVLLTYKSTDHRGVDVAADIGDSIVVAQDGVVIWIGKTPRGEPCVSIEHSDGLSSTYLPVNALVAKGQEVIAGEAIGTLSENGDPSCDKTHLHFGIYRTVTRDNKEYINPCDYLLPIPSQEFQEEKSEAQAQATPLTVQNEGLKSDTAELVGGSVPVGGQTADLWKNVEIEAMEPDAEYVRGIQHETESVRNQMPNESDSLLSGNLTKTKQHTMPLPTEHKVGTSYNMPFYIVRDGTYHNVAANPSSDSVVMPESEHGVSSNFLNKADNKYVAKNQPEAKKSGSTYL